MYSEKDDFEQHKEQVRLAIHELSQAGYRLDTSETVIDVGGGHGMHTGFLSNHFKKVYCVDILNYGCLYNGEFNKLAAEKHERNSIQYAIDKIAYIESDAMDLLFKDNYFDCAVSFNAFEHIPNPGLALKEIIRVLKPNGFAYITFDPIWTCDTGGHFFHRAPTPWAHLILTKDEYHQEMFLNGASEEEVHLFDTGMNRWRLSQFEKIFIDAVKSKKIKVLFHEHYSATLKDIHQSHPNFMKAIKLGYTKHELLLRNLRWVIQKV